MAKKSFYIIPFYIEVIVITLSSVVNSFPKLFSAENPIFLQNGKEEYSLDGHIAILKDTARKWNIEDVSSDSLSKMFMQVNMKVPNLGFSDAVFWIRFNIIDTLKDTKDGNLYLNNKWFLINNYSALEDIRLYYPDDQTGKFIENKAGLIALLKDKVIHNLEFVSILPLQKDKLNTFYIRITTGSPVIFSLGVVSADTFFNQSSIKLFYHGVLFGILFLIIAYNSFLYFSIKEKTYLFYVLYIFSCASFLFMYEGYYTTFFGRIFDRDYYTLQMVAVSSLGPFWLLLTRDFLLTKKYLPSIYNLLNLLIVVSVFIILLLFFLPLSTAVSIFTISDILFLVLSLAISIITIKKGYKLSKFYLLALSGTLIGACILSARNINVLPYSFLTNNAFQLGILWEAIILSYSLGYRVSDLEKRVEERTSDLMHRTEELKNLSAHLQTVREEERKYISAEIHDEFGSTLSLLKMELFKLQKLDADQPSIYNPLLNRVDKTIKKVQQIATELRPEILDDLGLIDAIDWYCEEFQKKTLIACSVNLNVPNININKDLSLDIFRTLQESLTNVVRHSKAKHVSVDFSLSNNKIEMNMIDDGIGITNEQINDTKSIGLIGMRERLHKWNGIFSIFRNKKNGTTVYISVPLLNEDAAMEGK